jgi:hypothetical protein
MLLEVPMNPDAQPAPDLDQLKAEILDLHAAFIDAHLNADVEALLENQADQLYFVTRGDVELRTVEATRALLSEYLQSTVFTEYRDVQGPIVGVSADGSLGWSIVQVKVAGTRHLGDGSQRELDFTCAWLTLYQRRGDRWMRTAEVSTFR